MTSGSSAARRALLRIAPNPRASVDYLVRLAAAGHGLHLALAYVPDAGVLLEGAFADWAAAAPGDGPDPLEAVAAALLDDLDDILLPRYLDLEVARGEHRVRFVLRQPRWDNPALLALLR